MVAKQKQSKELTVTGNVAEIQDYIPGAFNWDVEAPASDQVAGADLAKDELLDALVGVPFMIYSLTFRPGIRKAGIDYMPAYVSCESVIAPEHVLKRRRVNMADLPFEPESQVIFNDGSTGIYRQIVAYLAGSGRIILPDGNENGGYGESIYDLPPSEWEGVNAGEILFDQDGFAHYRINVRLTCPRGVRLSEYQNDYNPNGSKTRYLA